jgi:nicotinamide phosphoribosyltransferase
MNIITITDSYKVSHYRQYPPNTNRVFSFFESRGGRYPDTIFFGLQYIIKKYLVGKVVSERFIQEAKELFTAHFGDSTAFNEAGWRHILEKHDGHLPIEIKAIPEGTKVPVSNVLVTAANTDPAVPWLTNYIETLLVQMWYPITVATQSYYMKKTINRFLEQTGTPELIDFKLHDFGFRGSTSVESAGIGGCAHLVNFKGTDTVEALLVAKNYYNEPMAGFSIPAAEHSTITSWGKDNELLAFKNMLEQYPKGLVAVVSDSYDIYKACENLWGKELKDMVLNRDGCLVIRPDSGDACEVLPRILDILGSKFGYEINKKGFKVLNPKVRVIQGDGITYDSLHLILSAVVNYGWSADNLAFGSGGGLLQNVNRDTQKFAFKCSAIELDGVWQNVIKTPITDMGKKSKAGVLALIKYAGLYSTVDAKTFDYDNLLKPVFRDGKLLIDQNLSEIRALALAN